MRRKAGKKKKIPISPSPEESGKATENTVKVLARKRQASLRWLELPYLDQPIVQRNSVTRSSNLLESLSAAIRAEQLPTRSLKVSASLSHEWTTKQILVAIAK